MMNPTQRHPTTPRGLGAAVLLLAILGMSMIQSGCNSTQPSSEQKMASVSFSIAAGDVLADPSDSSQGRLSALSLHALGFSYTDVKAIRIDVTEKDSKHVLYKNFDLTTPPVTTPAAWTGTLPFLPKSTPLLFTATAYGAGTPSPDNTLFLGSTEQSLSGNNEPVVIVLHAANDNRDITIPRIRKISLPSVFNSDQSGNVSFTVEATTGEKLDYSISEATGGGTFYPPSGSITLAGTVGTFVSQYVPPAVSSETTFEHTVTVTNSKGHSVTTSFKTKVRPPGSTSGVKDAVLQVLFCPVINNISTRRIGSNVLFTATVSDEPPVSLSYSWTFTPDPVGAFPEVTFSGNTNPSSLQNYTKAVQGTVRLSVKDANDNTTTLNYSFAPDQFPDESDQVIEGPLTGVNTLRAGENHTCALFNNGTLRCWGRGHRGQLGNTSTLSIGDDETPASQPVVPIVGVGSKLAVGGNHTCILLNSGYVRCWGNNEYGQLGYNTTEHVGDGEAISSYGYVNIGGIAIKLAAGYEHTCALMDTGNVRCWGRNQYGQLGYVNGKNSVGDNEQPFQAGDVKVGGTVKDIVAGNYHTCALLTSGKVRCWGLNSSYESGNPSYTNNIGDDELPSSVPEVSIGGTVLQLAAGGNHTCALLTDSGYLRCWGLGTSGQLGYGNTASSYNATADVNTGDKVLQVATGEAHTCALLSSGTIKCWGWGTSGQLGNNATNVNLSVPGTSTVDLGGSTAYQIAAGSKHTCALLSNDTARCWGSNAFGQLGYAKTTPIIHPATAGSISLIPSP